MSPTSPAVSEFQDQLSKLRVHKHPERGPSLKKPLLLALVLSKIAKGEIRENRIRFKDIEDELRRLIVEHGNLAPSASPAPEEPFFYLHTSPFWRLELGAASVPGTGKKRKPSAAALRAADSYASLPQATFDALASSPDACRRMIRDLLEAHAPRKTGLLEKLTRG